MKKLVVLMAGLLALGGGQALAGEWGYDGQEGVYTPEHWGHVSAICEEGHAQSPIDIRTDDAVRGEFKLVTNYEGDLVNYLNNGHAVVVSGTRYVELGEELAKYDLVQFHFHTLSEHTVNGQHYPMELHLVHADADMNLAVLGVFIEEGEENAALEEVFANLPHGAHGDVVETLTAALVDNYEQLLPRNRSFYKYSGSLTTPPCSEGVQWHVFTQPIQMSAAQIEHYRSLFAENGVLYDTNRPVQALNDREIIKVRAYYSEHH